MYRCTLVGIIFCGKSPPMGFDDRLADAQPDPHTFFLRREERFERSPQLLFGKAGALISDADFHTAYGVWQRTNHYFAFSDRARCHRVQGIEDEIQ